MIYWKCENEECEKHGEEIIEATPMFKYTPNGTVPINIPYCKSCGKQMGYREELPVQEGPINIGFAKFNSMSDGDKATMLKTRYKEGLKKEDIQDRIKAKREQATKSFFGG